MRLSKTLKKLSVLAILPLLSGCGLFNIKVNPPFSAFTTWGDENENIRFSFYSEKGGKGQLNIDGEKEDFVFCLWIFSSGYEVYASAYLLDSDLYFRFVFNLSSSGLFQTNSSSVRVGTSDITSSEYESLKSLDVTISKQDSGEDFDEVDARYFFGCDFENKECYLRFRYTIDPNRIFSMHEDEENIHVYFNFLDNSSFSITQMYNNKTGTSYGTYRNTKANLYLTFEQDEVFGVEIGKEISLTISEIQKS